MIITRKKLLLAAAAVFGLTSATVTSAIFASSTFPASIISGKSFYVGAQLGKSSLGYSGTSYTLPRNSVDDQPWGTRIYAGYSFTDLLAAEMGYGYYGKAEFKDNATGNKQSMLQQGIDLTGKVTIPLDFGFGFYIKAGGIWLHRDALESRSNFFASKSSDSSLAFLGGLGVSYNFNPTWSMDLSWTGTMRNGDLPRMYFYGLGVTYRFNSKSDGAY